MADRRARQNPSDNSRASASRAPSRFCGTASQVVVATLLAAAETGQPA